MRLEPTPAASARGPLPLPVSRALVGLVLLLGSCADSNAPEAGGGGPSPEGGGDEQVKDQQVRDQQVEAAKPDAAPRAGAEAPTGVATPASTRPAGLPQSGRPAPELTLPDVETNEPWSLAAQVDPSGESCPKGVLVAFMASWCTYCTKSLPTLAQIEKDNPDLAVVTVTVDATDQARQAELDKVRKAGLTGPVLAADEATVATWVGGGRSVPKYYFVNHNGIMVAKDEGFGDKVGPMMPAQAKRALAD